MLFNKKLFSLVDLDKSKFYFTIIFGVFVSVFTIAQAFLLSRIINNVFLLNYKLWQVDTLIILFIISFSLKASLQFLQSSFSAKFTISIKKKLREDIIENIIKIGPIKIKSERTGEIVNTLLNGVDKLEDYFSKFLPQIFLSAFIPLIILLFVLPRDFLSAIIFVVTAPIIPTFMFLIGSASESLNKKQWKTLSRMSAYFFDVLQGIPTLKLFNRSKETIKRIEEISNIFRIKTLKVLRVAFLSALVLEVASTISVAIIAVAIGLRLLNGDFNFADALFILIIAPEFYLPLRQLGVSYHSGMEGVAAFERIDNLLELKNNIKDESEIKESFSYDAQSEIKFENVSFTYEGRNQKALDSISFTIEPNKFTALIGQTGSGKTTLMNLLLKFLQVENGTIKIGNHNLNDISTIEWRKNISWLPQNPHLFNTTILENLLLAKEDATKEEIIEACKKAKIHHLISSLPNGYESKVSETGENFSGGEIQRLALARAYLRNAKIIFVDEPTANLDATTEHEIINDMLKLFNGKTIIMIAHKLNTIIRADKIIVLKNGKVIDEGNHQELMQKSDYYKKLISNMNQ
ncbi:Subfamily C ATP-binding cassette [Ignavibacterium album JCM 16511]|uniref:Subfamily C ATP-binding cassette n=1 Tax=Ignavibacterium album (strain DSM 19864 / JCM 16511 / NBRC 101810 / Mat9-16) TaxID=945713 RepID=I0AIK6_IGNAJ|nr:thiol reductant ABC exporter subunit CydD [Ignavibacterium album]AFH48813.1 Subfamily C ATP-binding cassette [Ignavibacterium album JCM 16511]